MGLLAHVLIFGRHNSKLGGRDKMAAISQTALSNAFSWKKLYKLRLIFHWSSNQQYSSIGPDIDLALTRRQAIIWNDDG